MSYGRSNILSRTTKSCTSPNGTCRARTSLTRKLVNITIGIPMITKRKIANLKEIRKANRVTVPTLLF